MLSSEHQIDEAVRDQAARLHVGAARSRAAQKVLHALVEEKHVGGLFHMADHEGQVPVQRREELDGGLLFLILHLAPVDKISGYEGHKSRKESDQGKNQHHFPPDGHAAKRRKLLCHFQDPPLSDGIILF